MKADRKVPLVLGHTWKPQADIPHHGLPMAAALRMKFKLDWHDNNVLYGIVDMNQRTGKTFVPLFAIG